MSEYRYTEKDLRRFYKRNKKKKKKNRRNLVCKKEKYKYNYYVSEE